MAISNIRGIFDCDVKTVWDIVTSLYKISWRSDLSRITLLGENQFIEYTKRGYETRFIVTGKEDYKRWEFDLENTMMTGHWRGVFVEKGGSAVVEFTENVKAKRFFLKPFLGLFLKRQQKRYMEDLKKEIQKVKAAKAGKKNRDTGKKN